MKKIKYKKLTIQNFLSIGKDAVVVDFKEGLNLITGQNIDNPERKNAVGKSTILNAFFFALFGETIGKIKNEFLVNFITKTKGKVELEFDVHTDKGAKSYKIVRQIKPSKVFLFRGDEDVSRDSISNTNKDICQLISSNPAVHKSCEIMTLNDTTPFMSLKAQEKRKFIEDIFTIEVFGLMLKDLKKMITENKKNLSINSALMDEVASSIKNTTDNLGKLREKEKNWKSVRDSQIEEREKELETHEVNLKKLDEMYDSLDIDAQYEYLKSVSTDELNEKLKFCNDSIQAIKMESSTLMGELKPLVAIQKLGDVCPTCQQSMDSTHCDEIAIKISDLGDKISKKESECKIKKDAKDKVEQQLKEIQVKLDTCDRVIAKGATIKSKRKEVELKIETTMQLIENLKNDEFENGATDLLEKDLEGLIETQNERKGTALELKTQSEDYEICKFILSDEGVKSFVIKRLVGMLNATIDSYLKAMGINIKCVFDEYFDETITTSKNRKLSYSNLSGAEKRSVDIASVLSFSDMRKKISGVSSNVQFYDEVFDNAFDERGLDMFITTLKDRISKNKICGYAISHRKETAKHVDGETIYLEKEHDITRRV